MRPLVLLWGCLLLPGSEALKGPKEVSGFEGDTLSLKCTYGEESREHTKYWCQEAGTLLSRCSGTLSSGRAGQENRKGRVSIRDNPQELSFTVTLRTLTLKDTGKYWCGVSKLGLDETFLVSLIVFPASPGLRPTVTTAKQGKTGAKASPFPGTAPYVSAGASPHPGTSANAGASPHPGTSANAGASPHPGTSRNAGASPHPGTSANAGASPHPGTSVNAGASPHPGTSRNAGASPHPGTSANAGSSPHTATSPHAGSSRPATHLDPTSAEDTSPAPSSRSSEPGVSIPRTRLLAPVLVLVALLLATGLIALGDHMLRWRKKVPLAMETQKNEKVYLPITPLGNDCVPAETLMNLPGPTGPLASPQPSAGAYREIQCLRQTTEEPEAPSQGPKEHQTPCPAPPLSEEELRFSEFIPV